MSDKEEGITAESVAVFEQGTTLLSCCCGVLCCQSPPPPTQAAARADRRRRLHTPSSSEAAANVGGAIYITGRALAQLAPEQEQLRKSLQQPRGVLACLLRGPLGANCSRHRKSGMMQLLRPP